MQSNFNDTINQLSNFSIEPNKQNWKDIEKHLPQQKNKNILVGWWRIPGLLLTGFVFIVYSLPMNNSFVLAKNNNLIKKDVATNINNTSTKSRNNLLSITVNNIVTTNKTLSHTNSSSPFKTTKNIEIKQENKVFATSKLLSIKNRYIKNVHNNQPIKNNEFHQATDNLANKKNTDVTLNKLYKSNDSFPIKDTTSKEINTQIVNNTSKKDNILDNKTQKKPIFSLTLGGGLNYVSRNNILGQHNDLYSYNSLNNTFPTGIFNTLNSEKLPLFRTGFNITLGINIDFPLSKKLVLKSGLLYNYLQNNIGVNTNSQNANYYNYGNQIMYKNQLHLISLPVGLGYCINPAAKNKLSLLAGINSSYVIKNKWLFVDESNALYEVNNTHLNKLFFGLQTGIAINFNNKFSIGLQATKTLSSIQKVSTKYYLQQLNIQLNIPLKFQKK